jgi:two-component sensor histidine kinase
VHDTGEDPCPDDEKRTSGRAACGGSQDTGGFGSKLLTRILSTQLPGSIDREWSEEGVVATIRIPKDGLTR